MKPVKYFLYIIITGALSCKEQAPASLFTILSPGKSGISFENKVDENEQLNIMSYEYLYNGAGVAIGDINNDGLADIYFTGNMVPDKLYLNKGGLKFEDITAQAGVAGRDRWKTGVTMADINNDGLLDIYVCYSGPGTDEARSNELFINNGVHNGLPSFTEKAREYGLDAPGTFSTQCAFFDMDLDGDLDAFLVNHADMFYNAFYNTTKLRTKRHPKFGNRLYRNDNGKFTDISEQAGVYGGGINFGLSVSISDLNNDLWPDLYVSNDYNERDFLYLNNRNGTFREVLKESIGHISQFSMGSDIDDYNNDLQPDIFTLDMLPEDNKRQKLLKGPDTYDYYSLMVDSGFYHQNMRNMLQLNMGIGKDSIPQFSEIGQLAGISNTDWSWAPLLADFDNDGWKDLYITNGYLRDFTNLDFLKFTYTETQNKAKAAGKQPDTWELVKNLPSTRISNYLFSNNHNLTFSNKTKEWGTGQPAISTGAAYADLDNDGDLDLVINNSNQPADIYENNGNKLLQNHYIKIKLTGAPNTFALGAKVIVTTDSTKQLRELYTSRGFQSSVEPVLHFGLGGQNLIKNISIQWPGGKTSSVSGIKADTLITFNYKEAIGPAAPVQSSTVAASFTDYTTASGIGYVHKESKYFVDFKSQSLLLHQLSKQGPFLAKGDVNGDGAEDIFIGGSLSNPGQLYLQTAGEKFATAPNQPWAAEKGAKDAGMTFFDADNDKDLDLFIVKGGTEYAPNDPLYQAVLYLNNGKGRFVKSAAGLPTLTANSSCVIAADYDKDGDTDLFIGGRSVPNEYPILPTSYLLRNETKNGVIKFEYASEQPDKLLRQPGMVTTALWSDINNDSWPDLIVAGEFMPITIFENQQGRLISQPAKYGLNNTRGFWCKMIAADMDKDGDMDLIAGNLGFNCQFKASEKEPLSLSSADFDRNGTIDPIISYYIQGQQYLYNSLDELAEQLPLMRKKFLRYENYSNATFNEVFSQEQLKQAITYEATQLGSCYFENRNGVFVAHLLPEEVQFSMVQAIMTDDWNGDGREDLLIAGNYYPWRIQLGKMDACRGWILQGDGKGNFKTIYPAQTNFILAGDVRDAALLNSHTTPLIIATRNNDHAVVIKQNK